MVDPRRRGRQRALFLAALLLLNFPALALVDAAMLPGGVPLTPYYLLAAWLATIVAAALLAAGRGSG
jgi:hypothetical protein